MLGPLLLRMMRWFSPDPAFQIDVGPTRFQRLAEASTSQYLKSYSVGGALILVVGQNYEQSAQFVIGEPAFAAFFLKPFNALNRISLRHPHFTASESIFDNRASTRLA